MNYGPPRDLLRRATSIHGFGDLSDHLGPHCPNCQITLVHCKTVLMQETFRKLKSRQKIDDLLEKVRDMDQDPFLCQVGMNW
jgi:hypothetical protein